MADVGAVLPGFLDRAARTPFVYGQHDCLLWLADWVFLLTGLDPAAHIRGHFRTALACARYVAAVGSVSRVVGDCAETGGLITTDDRHRPGDIGVALMPTGRKPRQVGGLYSGRRWVFLTPSGLLAVSTASTIATWRLP